MCAGRAEMFGLTGSDIKAKCFLLEPMQMDMTVVRNLSSMWYHDQPLATVSFHVPTVNVRSLKPFLKIFTVIIVLN